MSSPIMIFMCRVWFQLDIFLYPLHIRSLSGYIWMVCVIYHHNQPPNHLNDTIYNIYIARDHGKSAREFGRAPRHAIHSEVIEKCFVLFMEWTRYCPISHTSRDFAAQHHPRGYICTWFIIYEYEYMVFALHQVAICAPQDELGFCVVFVWVSVHLFVTIVGGFCVN